MLIGISTPHRDILQRAFRHFCSGQGSTARGNERKDIFRDDTDRFHFLELLSEMPERFGSRLHAYVLMDNHFHLMIETPEANLSRSMHWNR